MKITIEQDYSNEKTEYIFKTNIDSMLEEIIKMFAKKDEDDWSDAIDSMGEDA